MDSSIALPAGAATGTYRRLIALGIAAAIGGAGWSGIPYLLPLSLGLFGLWALAPSRLDAVLVAFVYYLAASRGIPPGAGVFFGEGPGFGVLLWVGAAALLSLPYALCWQRRGAWRWVPLLVVLITLPPIGIVGYANPVTAAGIMFPGWGWFGLALCLGLATLIARVPLAGVLTVVACITPWAHTVPVPPPGWAALETSYLMGTGKPDVAADVRRQRELAAQVATHTARVVVLPETIAGRWTPASWFLWRDATGKAAAEGRTVLIGAELGVSSRYDNTVLRLGMDKVDPVYRQLMPVPVSMWRPWNAVTANAHWFEAQSAVIDGRRTAFLICYEQLLGWPPAVAFSTRPDVLVGLSNDWWARDTSIPAIQHAAMVSWAKLFDVALVEAVNR